MHCIFCKKTSSQSKSVEHIIPESLGNKEHILPKGWVCDECNNYLARKIEGPFLNSTYGRQARFEMDVANKMKRIPPGVGFHPQSKSMVNVFREKDGICIAALESEDEERFIETFQSSKTGSLYIADAQDPPLDYLTVRFVAKIAVEALAFKFVGVPDGNRTIVDEEALDPLREYVRQGKPAYIWPVDMRRIYPAQGSYDENGVSCEVLHEFDILPISSKSENDGCYLCAVIVIFGLEYVISLGDPSLSTYRNWLKKNGYKSYLYSGKHAELYPMPACS